ncbi:50S ribosomal protein L24 [Candidatus Woesearchaeota archaeon]|nr:50S ribosomal protein L24 [Candidatus Woesearchaeota archaeon]
MDGKFSKEWKRSGQTRKQRLYRYNAPLHIKGKFVNACLSKDLRKKHHVRSMRLKKGDKVRIMVGQFKKTEGKISLVDMKNTRVYVEGADIVKKDGTKASYPINPSNLMIVELVLDDKKRQKRLDRKAPVMAAKEKAGK